MRRRRRAEERFTGLIILVAIVVGILSAALDFMKKNLGFAALALMVLIYLFVRSAKRKSARKREAEKAVREYLDWGISRAVSIAQHQQWVSPHRLRTQVHITEKQAMEFLENASALGLLHQEINGRYYLTAAPEITKISLPKQ